MLIYKLLFVHLGKIVNELLFLCEVNEQKNGFSFPETDLWFLLKPDFSLRQINLIFYHDFGWLKLKSGFIQTPKQFWRNWIHVFERSFHSDTKVHLNFNFMYKKQSKDKYCWFMPMQIKNVQSNVSFRQYRNWKR